MVCLICLAVMASLGAAILTPDLIEKLTSSLRSKMPDVEKVSDSKSVTKWMGTYRLKAGGASVAVPVAVYAFKDHKRVRIQVLTHELTRAQVEFVQDEMCKALDAQIIGREFPEEGLPEHKAAEPKRAETAKPPTDLQPPLGRRPIEN